MKPEFSDTGFDFYNDRSRWQGTFFAANGLDELDASPLGELKGKIDVIWSLKLLHLFPRDTQVTVAAHTVSLLKPVRSNMFVGAQNGLTDPKEIHIQEGTAVGMQKSFFLGNADTIKEIWNEGAKQTGSKWNVESKLLDLRTKGLHQGDGSEYSKVIGYNLH